MNIINIISLGQGRKNMFNVTVLKMRDIIKILVGIRRCGKSIILKQIIEELIKIRGVGRWTAENFLLFGLGRPNLFPKADIGIQNAIKLLYNLERKPTMEEMAQFSKEWHPYLSYASLYLWRSIEKRRNIDEATGSISP